MLSRNAMDRVRRSGLRRRSGGAVLEMALTMTMLFSLVFGMIEFGFFFFVKNTMQNAAREGCRAGIVATGTNTTINTSIITQLYNSGIFGTGGTQPGVAIDHWQLDGNRGVWRVVFHDELYRIAA